MSGKQRTAEDYENAAVEALSTHDTELKKRPAGNVGSKVAAKAKKVCKAEPQAKATKPTKALGLKLGCSKCRGAEGGCAQCRNPRFAGWRGARAQYDARTQKRG